MNIENILKKLKKMRCLRYELHTHEVHSDDIILRFIKEWGDSDWKFRSLNLECWSLKDKAHFSKYFIDITQAQFIIDELNKRNLNNLTLEEVNQIEKQYNFPMGKIKD